MAWFAQTWFAQLYTLYIVVTVVHFCQSQSQGFNQNVVLTNCSTYGIYGGTIDKLVIPREKYCIIYYIVFNLSVYWNSP